MKRKEERGKPFSQEKRLGLRRELFLFAKKKKRGKTLPGKGKEKRSGPEERGAQFILGRKEKERGNHTSEGRGGPGMTIRGKVSKGGRGPLSLLRGRKPPPLQGRKDDRKNGFLPPFAKGEKGKTFL